MKKVTIALALLGMTLGSRHSFAQATTNEHKVVVTEVLQTTNYTYLHVKDKNGLVWLAVPSMQAKAGDTYYYVGGLSMKDFESKELHRKFDEVFFLGGVSSESITANSGKKTESYTRKAAPEVKKDVKIQIPQDCTPIAKLLADKNAYAGKTVKIKGQVTKYNQAIMDKNWIHLQDGTESNGKFDLVITTSQTVKVGDVVTLEGKIALNKDFGYGYLFDVMMEGAVLK